MKWIKGEFGFDSIRIGRAYLSVGWDSTGPKGESTSGYVATLKIAGARTKKIPSQDDAKAAIVRILKRTCEQILEELSEPPKEKP